MNINLGNDGTIEDVCDDADLEKLSPRLMVDPGQLTEDLKEALAEAKAKTEEGNKEQAKNQMTIDSKSAEVAL